MRRRRLAATVSIGAALSVLLAPSLVLLIGLRIRGGPLSVPDFSALQIGATYVLFGLVQFGLFFLGVGLIAGWLSAFGARHGRVARAVAVLVPTGLLPIAAVLAIVWSNRGGMPLIQDTRPYFIGSFPAGFLVGLLTMLFAMRKAGEGSVTGDPA